MSSSKICEPIPAVPVKLRLLHPSHSEANYLSVETYHQIPLEDFDSLMVNLRSHLNREVPRYIEEQGYVGYGDRVKSTLLIEVKIGDQKRSRELSFSTFSKICNELSALKMKTLENILKEKSFSEKMTSSSPPLNVELKVMWKHNSKEQIPNLWYYCYPPGDEKKTINEIMVRIDMLM
jgi:hypothetical protein